MGKIKKLAMGRKIIMGSYNLNKTNKLSPRKPNFNKNIGLGIWLYVFLIRFCLFLKHKLSGLISSAKWRGYPLSSKWIKLWFCRIPTMPPLMKILFLLNIWWEIFSIWKLPSIWGNTSSRCIQISKMQGWWTLYSVTIISKHQIYVSLEKELFSTPTPTKEQQLILAWSSQPIFRRRLNPTQESHWDWITTPK